MAGLVTLDVAGLDAIERELAAALGQIGAGDLEVAWRFGGPAAPYALYVHENLDAAHPRGGTAQFVTRPLSDALPHLAAAIAADVQHGATLAQALREEAEIVMTAMKATTPVETGALRESGHVVGPGPGEGS